MTDSNGRAVYAAIAAVAADMAEGGIGKTRKNTQQGYNFRGIDDVYNALAPSLARHGLVILPRVLTREVSERTTAKGGTLFYVVVETEFDFIAVEDGSSHTIRTFGEAMDSGDKATNKAMSAAYKYAAFQAFCIPTEGDNDADSTTHDVKPARRVADEDKPHPRQVKTPEQATAQMAEEDAAVESWRKAIEATDDLDALVDMLGAIHEERNNFRRVGALRIWAKMLAEVGDVAHIKTAGAAVKAWPEGTAGRSEVLSILTAAYNHLKGEAKSEDAA